MEDGPSPWGAVDAGVGRASGSADSDAVQTSAISMRSIVKSFGSVLANDHISMDLEAGEIHALVGQNGAGKTTLMRVLFGSLRPDAGEIVVNGVRASLHSPKDALAIGIGMVHQQFQLLPSFTVAENVVLGSVSQRITPIHRSALEAQVNDVARRFGLAVEPRRLVGELSVDLQQRVEILKLLYREATTLILDEPTAALGPREIDAVFDVLRRLREYGRTIVIITHKMKEVVDLADRVTVLRAGRVVARATRGQFNENELAYAMVGRYLTAPKLQHGDPSGGSRLEVDRLVVLDDRGVVAIDEVNLEVRQGEILGVAGVEGNGQQELGQALSGVRPPSAGRIKVDGVNVAHATPRDLRQLGVGVATEDRLTWDLIPDLTLAENLLLPLVAMGAYSRWGLLRQSAFMRDARQLLEDHAVDPPDPSIPASSLSGGNQQKLVLAREVSRRPGVFIVAQPTRGLDVAATYFVHQELDRLRANGTALLLITNDLDELLALSDRIVVLYRGRSVYTDSIGNVSVSRIAEAMAGLSQEQ